MFTSIIVAKATNHVIGRKGVLPWRSSRDLEWLQEHTVGKVCIVGRGTYQSLPPLRERHLIVLSRDIPLDSNAKWSTSLESALLRARDTITLRGLHPEVMILGGQKVYEDALTLKGVHRIYETTVGTDIPDGDRFFPELPTYWKCIFQKKTFDDRAILDNTKGVELTFRILQKS